MHDHPALRTGAERTLVQLLLARGVVAPGPLRELLDRRARDPRPLPLPEVLQAVGLCTGDALDPLVAEIRKAGATQADAKPTVLDDSVLAAPARPTSQRLPAVAPAPPGRAPAVERPSQRLGAVPPSGSARLPATAADPLAASRRGKLVATDGSTLALGPGVEVTVERTLGKGGMGVVLLVRDPRLGRRAALKLALDAEKDERRALRFRRETVVTARLDHPNIPPVFEAGRTTAGQDYLLMRFVDGRALSVVIRELHEQQDERPRRLREVIAALVRTGEAVAYAHSQGVIHRDLKPDNIMVGAFGEVLVMDWGLARLTAESADEDRNLRGELGQVVQEQAGLTQDGACLGTLGYMPPEQARGTGDVDGRADVYALGAVLCQAISGELPLSGSTAFEMLAETLAGTAAVPDAAAAPPELRAIADRALQGDPDDRYESMEALTDDLRAWLEGRPVSAYEYRALEQALRFVRAHPALVSGLVVAFLGVIGTTAAVVRARARGAEASRAAAVARARQDALAANGEALRAGASLADRLGRALATLQAAQRWRVLAPGETEAEGCLFTAACGLGEVALEGEQWALAREAFQQAKGTGVDVARADALLERTDRLASENARRRREEVQGALLALESGGAADGEAQRDAVFTLVRHREPETVAQLVAALDRITARLEQLELAAYLEAALPDEAEVRLGAAPLAGLEDAWRRRKVGKATADDEEVVALAGKRLAARVQRNLPISTSGRRAITPLSVIASRQSAGLTVGEATLSAAAAEALGRLGLRAGALPALERYLAAEHDPHRAAVAGVALARLAGKDAFAVLRGVARRLGWNSPFTARLRSALGAQQVELGEATDASNYIALGDELRQLGRMAEAEEAYGRAVALDPRSAVAANDRGLARAEQGKLEDALEDYEVALRLDPTLAAAYANRGALRLRQQQLAEAAEDLRRSVELDPGLSAGWTSLAGVLVDLGQYDEAIAAADRALALDADLVLARLNRGVAHHEKGSLEAALADFDAALELDPTHHLAHFQRGRVLRRLERNAASREAYDRAVQLQPTNGSYLAERGGVRADLGEVQAGLADCERALELSPTDGTVWAMHGQVLQLSGRLDEAMASAVKGCELQPRSGLAWTLRANLHYGRGEYAQGVAAGTKALELQRHNPMALNNRALCHLALGQLAEAVQDLRRATELAPSYAMFWSNLGYALQQTGDRAGAVAAYTDAITRTPGLAIAWSNRGLLRLQAGELRLAKEDLEKAVALDPALPHAWCNLAACLLQLDDLDGGLRAAESASQRAPNLAAAWTLRAQARLRKGDARQALSEVSEALRLDPNLAEGLGLRGLARLELGDKLGAREDIEASLKRGPNSPLAPQLKKALARTN